MDENVAVQTEPTPGTPDGSNEDADAVVPSSTGVATNGPSSSGHESNGSPRLEAGSSAAPSSTSMSRMAGHGAPDELPSFSHVQVQPCDTHGTPSVIALNLAIPQPLHCIQLGLLTKRHLAYLQEGQITTKSPLSTEEANPY